MPRSARIILPGLPHHVTQRGSRRQPTFLTANDYASYLRLAAEEFAAAGVEVWAYCLMPNHVHLIATPQDEAGLARAVGRTHQRYTRMINLREGWSGHVWQNRFASFATDDVYLERCLRYVALNPVRASLTRRAVDWRWSSARAHVLGEADALLTPGPIVERFSESLASILEAPLPTEDLALVRFASLKGRPLVRLEPAGAKAGTRNGYASPVPAHPT